MCATSRDVLLPAQRTSRDRPVLVICIGHLFKVTAIEIYILLYNVHWNSYNENQTAWTKVCVYETFNYLSLVCAFCYCGRLRQKCYDYYCCHSKLKQLAYLQAKGESLNFFLVVSSFPCVARSRAMEY